MMLISYHFLCLIRNQRKSNECWLLTAAIISLIFYVKQTTMNRTNTIYCVKKKKYSQDKQIERQFVYVNADKAAARVDIINGISKHVWQINCSRNFWQSTRQDMARRRVQCNIEKISGCVLHECEKWFSFIDNDLVKCTPSTFISCISPVVWDHHQPFSAHFHILHFRRSNQQFVKIVHTRSNAIDIDTTMTDTKILRSGNAKWMRYEIAVDARTGS